MRRVKHRAGPVEYGQVGGEIMKVQRCLRCDILVSTPAMPEWPLPVGTRVSVPWGDCPGLLR